MPSHRRYLGFVAFGLCLTLAGGWLWNLRPRVEAGTAVAAQATHSQEGFPYTNRLVHEKSPYLLLHAHNPVDWYPWGAEAFEKARREQKPVFLSIGYYTCHWCHVMERESYSDPGIAEILNRDFVAIKVDREERPDVDRLYIAYVEATTGSAGWPLNVFLTPDLKPFFGGTYFPRDDSGGKPGLRTLLLRIADVWAKDRQKVIETANSAARELTQFVTAAAPVQGELKTAVLDKGYTQIAGIYDPVYGGFGGAPKFPRPVVFDFLLRIYARTGQKGALEMTVESLRAMARGGVHDQIGGGFHRYTTDNRWRVPHFEKMLYDQAQLAGAYVEAYQATHNPLFAATARDILDFVLREMNGPEGGFVSAEDADSLVAADKPERREGAFYVWTAKQVEEILGKGDAAILDYAYGIEPGGNVPASQDVRGELQGENVLFEAHTTAETGNRFGLSEGETRSKLAAAKKKLLQARLRRPHPPLDDKVVTAWNGLMIGALARASQVLDEPRYLSAAQWAADFIRAKLYDEKSGTLRRRYRGGEAAVHGFLDDYAFLIAGLLDLYEASFDVGRLEWAGSLQSKQDQLFWDAHQGGYFDASAADSSLLARTREAYDGAEPSANSVAAMNLLRLAQITDNATWREEAEKTFAAFGGVLSDSPEAMPGLASALDFRLAKTKQILIAGRPGAPDTRALLKLVHERFLPNKILLLADGGSGQRKLARWLPFIAGATEKQGHATAYICENYVCKLPTYDHRTVARLLDGKS